MLVSCNPSFQYDDDENPTLEFSLAPRLYSHCNLRFGILLVDRYGLWPITNHTSALSNTDALAGQHSAKTAARRGV